MEIKKFLLLSLLLGNWFNSMSKTDLIEHGDIAWIEENFANTVLNDGGIDKRVPFPITGFIYDSKKKELWIQNYGGEAYPLVSKKNNDIFKIINYSYTVNLLHWPKEMEKKYLEADYTYKMAGDTIVVFIHTSESVEVHKYISKIKGRYFSTINEIKGALLNSLFHQQTPNSIGTPQTAWLEKGYVDSIINKKKLYVDTLSPINGFELYGNKLYMLTNQGKYIPVTMKKNEESNSSYQFVLQMDQSKDAAFDNALILLSKNKDKICLKIYKDKIVYYQQFVSSIGFNRYNSILAMKGCLLSSLIPSAFNFTRKFGK